MICCVRALVGPRFVFCPTPPHLEVAQRKPQTLQREGYEAANFWDQQKGCGEHVPSLKLTSHSTWKWSVSKLGLSKLPEVYFQGLKRSFQGGYPPWNLADSWVQRNGSRVDVVSWCQPVTPVICQCWFFKRWCSSKLEKISVFNCIYPYIVY